MIKKVNYFNYSTMKSTHSDMKIMTNYGKMSNNITENVKRFS